MAHDMTPMQLCADCDRLDSDRKNIEYQWDLIESYVMPNRGRFFTDLDSEEKAIDWRHRERFDDTAVFAAQSLAATIHSTLTNQASTWFGFKFRNAEVAKVNENARWLEACTKHIHTAITSGNFHVEVSEFYHDDVGFGSALMIHEIGSDGVHKFKSVMLRECYVEESADGELLKFYRKRKYTGLQLRDMFPDHTWSEVVQKEIDVPTDRKFTLMTCIYKNYGNVAKDEMKPIDDPEQRAFLQKYVLYESKEQVGKTHGYYSMPVYFLRWARTSGSRWGYSQSMVVMGHILTLQETVSMTLTANELAIEPPILATSRGVLGDMDLAPRGVTYVESMDSIKEFMTGARLDWGSMTVDQMQSVVRYAFFQDKLELKNSPAMTATEVNARMEQMQRFLGGAVIRAKADFLDPLVTRTFQEEFRAGRLPDMPPGLALEDVDIEYVGPLAKLQRLDAVDAYRNWIAMLLEASQVSPDVLDLPDYHVMFDDAGDRLGVPAAARNSLEKAGELKKTREGAMARQQEAEAMKTQMTAANQEGQALKNEAEANNAGQG